MSAEELLYKKTIAYCKTFRKSRILPEYRAFERELFKFLVFKFDVTVLKKNDQRYDSFKEDVHALTICIVFDSKAIKLVFTLKHRRVVPERKQDLRWASKPLWIAKRCRMP